MSIETSQPPQSAILIVEDDPDISMVLTDHLTIQGHCVNAVKTGTEAVDWVTRHHFDAVLLDVGLPDIDGLAVLRTLTQLKPHLPIIILTAYTSFGKTVGKLNIPGSYASLAKPYNLRELTATIRRALGYSVPASLSNRAQQAFCESPIPYQSVIESGTKSIGRTNQGGTKISWNRAAQA